MKMNNTNTTTTMKNNNHQQPKNRMVQQHYDQDFAALEKLKAQGLDYPGLSLRLLRKFDGDVDKVADRLQRRRDVMKRPKNSRSSQRWSAEIKQLQDAGLDYPVAANRLLNKFNGDVDKVAVILNKRKPQLEQRKAKMAQKKQRKQQKQQNMPATVSPNPSSNQRWSAEIKQLQDAGLDYPVAANRLLNKFNGDVDKVAVILNKRKPQLEQRKAKMAQQKQRKQQSMPSTVSSQFRPIHHRTNNGAPKSNSCKTRVWTIRWPPTVSSTSSMVMSTRSQSSSTSASPSWSSGRPRWRSRSSRSSRACLRQFRPIHHRTNNGAPKSNSCKTRAWTIRWPPTVSSTSSMVMSTRSQSSSTSASPSWSSGRPRWRRRSSRSSRACLRQFRPIRHRTNNGAPKSNSCKTSSSCKARAWTIRWPPTVSSTSSMVMSTRSQSSSTSASPSWSSGRPRLCTRSS